MKALDALSTQEYALARSAAAFSLYGHPAHEIAAYVQTVLEVHRTQVCEWLSENGTRIPADLLPVHEAPALVRACVDRPTPDQWPEVA
jgi:hypothetical protein